MKFKTVLVVALTLILLAGAAWQFLGWRIGSEPRAVESSRVALTGVNPVQDLLTTSPELRGRTQVNTSLSGKTLEPTIAAEEKHSGRALGSLEVLVTWRGGSPAEGVALLLIAPNQRRHGHSERWEETDDGGRVMLLDLAPGKYTVEADRGGKVKVEVKAGEAVTQTLELTGSYDVHGVVLDMEGRAVAGAEVIAASWRYDWRGAKVVATAGADGRFVIRCIRGAVESFSFEGRSLGARASGWAPSEFFHLARVDPAEVGENLIVEVVLTLRERGADIFGTVTGPDGAPLEGVMVAVGKSDLYHEQLPGGQLEAAPKPHVVETDESGRYTIEGVAAGIQQMAAWHRDWPVLSTEIELTPGVNLRRDLELVPGVIVSGQVTLIEGGPAPSSFVLALPEPLVDPFPNQGPTDRGSPFPHPRTKADGDGHYELGPVAPGELNLYASLGTSSLTEWAGEEPVYQGTLQETLVGSPGERLEWNPQLSLGFTIGGRALHADGTPMRDEFVTAIDPDGEHFAVTTRKDGAFLITNLKKRPHRVTFQMPHDAPKTASVEAYYDVIPPVADLLFQADYTPQPKAPHGKLRLRVEDEARLGAELNKGRIVPVVHYTETPAWRILDSDDDGLYEAKLRPGNYRVVLSAPSHIVLHAASFEIRSEETLDLGTLKTVPLASLDVTLVRPAGFDAPVVVRPLYYDAPTITVPQGGGVATFEELAPGEVRIQVSGEGIATETLSMELLPGDSNALEIPLRLATVIFIQGSLDKHQGFRRVELKVTGADGTEWLNRARREMQVDRWPFSAHVNLVPGSYLVQLETSDGQVARKELVVEAGDEQRTFEIQAR